MRQQILVHLQMCFSYLILLQLFFGLYLRVKHPYRLSFIDKIKYRV
jgi:hypothetical protein